MSRNTMQSISTLITAAFGPELATRAEAAVFVDPAIGTGADGAFTRGVLAMALNLVLFDDLLKRSVTARHYVADVVACGGRVVFDHGALRTIRFPDGPTGALPAGLDAFTRLLEPLGYRLAGEYPLPALRMTGRAYAHLDHAETIPQFFVSELHVDRFSPGFQTAAHRIFDSSADPLDATTRTVLARLAGGDSVDLADAAAALRAMAGAFDRQHAEPALADYEILRAESAEAAWIATEGNAFNHATDRVADVAALAAEQRAMGRPMKNLVEHSRNGRVHQTAFRADTVRRGFAGPTGERTERDMPGSFYEFITRDIGPDTGRIDLTFDSGNATGIFGMTRTAMTADAAE